MDELQGQPLIKKISKATSSRRNSPPALFFLPVFGFFCLALTWLPQIANATERDLEGSLLACADQATPATRLACFDGVVAALKTEPATERQTAPVHTAKAPPAAAAAPERFGKEHFTAEVADETLTARIEAVTVDGLGKLRITLDNGQIWAQRGTERYQLATGDTVVIERGTMNSFFLHRADSSRKIRFYRID